MAADSALSFVVDRLGQLLTDEAALLVGVRDEVEWIREQLKWMKSFLEDAYAKRRRGEDVAKDWERAVRDVSYHAEDIIESYMVKIIRRRQQSVRCCWILKSVETCARELKPRHKLGVEIKKLKAKINQIKENVTTYGLVQSAPNSATYTTLHRQRKTFPQHSDNHKQEILQDLLNTGITRRCVKSIVGMGGLGKTTLAKMVFNSDEIKSYFDTRAWVCVSQNYTPVDLFTIIGERIAGTEFQGLGESALREKIYQFLHGKSFSARGGWIEQSLAKLSELRKLCIRELETTQEKVLADALRKLQHLSCLELSGAHAGSMSAELIRALSSNDCLFELKLTGMVRERKLPDTFELPPYLTVLELHKTELEEDPMTTLEQLPNLASLTLGENSYVGNEMVCNSGGFLRLEALVLTSLHKLTSWSVAEGAMPKLAYVSIQDWKSSDELPMGLHNLVPVRIIMSPLGYLGLEFRRRIEEGNGKDLWRIKS